MRDCNSAESEALSDHRAGAPTPTTIAPSRFRSAARMAACKSLNCFRVAGTALPAIRASAISRAVTGECQPAGAIYGASEQRPAHSAKLPLFIRTYPDVGRRFWWCDLLHMRRARTGLPSTLTGSSSWRCAMVVIQDFVERESIAVEDSQARDLFSIAVFCGLGLLVSVSVLLLDQHVPGDWF